MFAGRRPGTVRPAIVNFRLRNLMMMQQYPSQTRQVLERLRSRCGVPRVAAIFAAAVGGVTSPDTSGVADTCAFSGMKKPTRQSVATVLRMGNIGWRLAGLQVRQMRASGRESGRSGARRERSARQRIHCRRRIARAGSCKRYSGDPSRKGRTR